MFAHLDSVAVIQPNNAGKCQDAATSTTWLLLRLLLFLFFFLFEFKSQCSDDLKPERKAFRVYTHKSWHRRRRCCVYSVCMQCVAVARGQQVFHLAQCIPNIGKKQKKFYAQYDFVMRQRNKCTYFIAAIDERTEHDEHEYLCDDLVATALY